MNSLHAFSKQGMPISGARTVAGLLVPTLSSTSVYVRRKLLRLERVEQTFACKLLLTAE